ncbi:NDP-hexose 2,3-dehydratase family protein [Pleurocapsa sp. PCC 7319]|uniref:NDP-hexose 2,3-dehydratase family protein n=1 Tax=Pleurocapsa sp. PCC 7319 TaxID=118161 RepID=UPI00034909A3|nr:NDP-hexose 2,3-dehydratase family protein [Pleurocapsa sp. PCC 7319]
MSRNQLLSKNAIFSPTSELERWLEEHRQFCDMEAEEISWQRSKEWKFEDRELRHLSGGFFSIVGATVYLNDQEQTHLEQPLINQPEIGILGFMVRKNGSQLEILVQAKPEPGNIGLIQAAPSVQATESNYKRRHHGKETPFLEYFLGSPKATILADSLQSEQGTRFLGKYNRNMIIEIAEDVAFSESSPYKWTRIENLCSLLIQDFKINTDARSVLVCSSWSTITPNQQPFSRWRELEGIGEALLNSYEAQEQDYALSSRDIIDRLEHCRNTAKFTTKIVSISDLKHWEMTENVIRSTNEDSFEVRQFQVKTTEREVAQWDQPLVVSEEEGEVILYAQEKNGVLHFLFNCRAEIGFRECCQYGPTIQNLNNESFILSAFEAKENELKNYLSRAKLLVSNLHSDEGGRFYKCISRYSIYLLDKDEAIDLGENLSWMTMQQIEFFANRQGFFSNEARSLISMLIAYI